MSNVYAQRVQTLRKRLVAINVDALVITHLPNVFYLSGFTGDSAALLVDEHRIALLTDGRFTVQAEEELQIDAKLVISRGPLATSIAKSLPRKQIRVGFEAGRTTVAQMQALRRAVQATRAKARWVALQGTVEALRAIKSPEEIAKMRRAARLASATMREILPLLKPGVREFEIAAEIEYRMRRQGAEGAAFNTIVAFGPRSALPHARPSAKKLRKNELVVLDLGAILTGYCSDLTRTVYVGKSSSRIRKCYEAVRLAQAAAIAATCKGTRCEDVDRAAREVLDAAGLEKYFVHSTGHGLGLEVHEDPRLARGQKQALQAGNVVTVEPGVYIKGVGGIRIEDDVAISPLGAETLTDAPRDFLEL